jgi:hypothetical protein
MGFPGFALTCPRAVRWVANATDIGSSSPPVAPNKRCYCARVRNLLSVVLVSLSGAALANMRGPETSQGGYSGSLASRVASDVRFHDEQLDISIDAASQDVVPRYARVDALYHLENRAHDALDVPVQFLGLAIEHAKISLNGRDVDFDLHTDQGQQRDVLRRLVEHRCARAAAGGTFEQPLEDLLRQIGGSCDDLSGVRKRIERVELHSLLMHDKLETVQFTLHLVPGMNEVRVSYEQPLFVREGEYGYFSSGFGRRGAVFGLDYLLYPARSWSLDPAFHLDVGVRLWHQKTRRLWRDRYVPQRWESNLSLVDHNEAHASPFYELRGKFSALPADIFSFYFTTREP